MTCQKASQLLFCVALRMLSSGFVLLTLATTAGACPFDTMQDFKIFRQAEVILVAKVASYSTEPHNHRAIFEFDTIRLIIGVPGKKRRTPARWRAEWRNSSSPEPAAWKGPSHVIIGLAAKIDGDGQPILYVVQQSCSRPSIVPASEANLQAILKDAGIGIHPDSPVLKDIPWQ